MQNIIIEEHDYDALYDIITAKQDYTTWSPSSLKVFLGCRFKYFLQYVKGWKITIRSPSLSLGTAFHAAAEKLNQQEALGKRTRKNELFSEFDLVWSEDTKDMVEGIHYKTANDLVKGRQIGLDLVEKHFNSRIRKSMSPTLYTPPYAQIQTPAVELQIDVPLVNMRTGKLYRDDHHITGFIDVVSIANKTTSHFDENSLMVIDYKTAAREWNQFSVDTNLQLLMYAYAMRYILRNENLFSHLIKDQEDLVGIVCLVKQKENRKSEKYGKIRNYMIRIADSEIDFLERTLLKCIEELEASGDLAENYLPNPTPENCRYCEYQEPCLLARRGARTPDILTWGEENGFLRKAN